MQTPSSTFTSQRKAPRRAFRHRVGILAKGHYQITQAHEIGEGGMALEIPFDLVIGQKVVLTFKVDQSAIAITTAEVRYVNPSSSHTIAGFQFLNLTFSIKREIRNYVAEKSIEEHSIKNSVQKPALKVG